MTANKMIFFEEPRLEFGHAQLAEDPRVGLTLFGPFDGASSSKPGKINYAVIGTEIGAGLFKRWSKFWQGPIFSDKDSNPKIWPLFPGFEAVFGCQWDGSPTVESLIDVDALTKACDSKDLDARVKAVVDLFLSSINSLKKSDERIDILICVVPDFVFQTCRPLSEGYKKPKRKISDQMSLFEGAEENFDFAPDFRRQIKARAMEFAIPIQIIRESTLALTEGERTEARTKYKRGLTPTADRAWNIATTAYYKAGGKPWKLTGVRDGVCYIGLAFRLAPIAKKTSGKLSACCAAQMFLKDGDGVIFKGEEGVWYSPEQHLFHLDKVGAEKLLAGVLKAYTSMGGKPLKEVFLHCPSGLSQDEYEGFCNAVPLGTKVVSVRIKRDPGFKLMRDGDWPIPRGAALKVSEKSAYLWASGFKFGLSTYDGTEIPVPLQIDLLHGEANILTVVEDILALTKLNYNACKFGESDPVTIKFADAVGEIFISNPETVPKPQFKFYI